MKNSRRSNISARHTNKRKRVSQRNQAIAKKLTLSTRVKGRKREMSKAEIEDFAAKNNLSNNKAKSLLRKKGQL